MAIELVKPKTKICKDCKLEKSLSEYSFCHSAMDGCQPYCRPCTAIRNKRSKFRIRYGLTVEEHTELFQKQDGLCASCSDYMRIPHLDHDHKTGRIRGFLCDSCNHIIGFAKEDIEKLTLCIEFLKKN